MKMQLVTSLATAFVLVCCNTAKNAEKCELLTLNGFPQTPALTVCAPPSSTTEEWFHSLMIKVPNSDGSPQQITFYIQRTWTERDIHTFRDSTCKRESEFDELGSDQLSPDIIIKKVKTRCSSEIGFLLLVKNIKFKINLREPFNEKNISFIESILKTTRVGDASI